MRATANRILTAIQNPLDLLFLKKIWKLGNIPVGISKIIPLGSAKHNNMEMQYPCFDSKVLSKHCPSRKNIVYICNQGFSTCCSLLTRNRILEGIIGATVEDYLSSDFYALITTYSFKQLSAQAGVSLRSLRPEHSNPCVLCSYIFSKSGKSLLSK